MTEKSQVQFLRTFLKIVSCSKRCSVSLHFQKERRIKVTSALLRHNGLGTKNLIQLDSMISHLLPKCQ